MKKACGPPGFWLNEADPWDVLEIDLETGLNTGCPGSGETWRKEALLAAAVMMCFTLPQTSAAWTGWPSLLTAQQHDPEMIDAGPEKVEMEGAFGRGRLLFLPQADPCTVHVIDLGTGHPGSGKVCQAAAMICLIRTQTLVTQTEWFPFRIGGSPFLTARPYSETKEAGLETLEAERLFRRRT